MGREMRTCKHCGILHAGQGKTFCSRECRYARYRAHPEERPPQMVPLGNRYVIDDGVGYMFIERGKYKAVTRVDAADVARLSAWTWNINEFHRRVVGRRPGSKDKFILSRVIMECPAGMVVDHINGDTLDNRRCNLRVVTIAENGQNRTHAYGNKESGLPRGVSIARRKNKTYIKAEGRLHGKTINIGYFKTVEEADAAARAWRAANMPCSAEGDGRVTS